MVRWVEVVEAGVARKADTEGGLKVARKGTGKVLCPVCNRPFSLPGLHGHMHWVHDRKVRDDELEDIEAATRADVKRDRASRLRTLKQKADQLESQAEEDGLGVIEIAAIGAAIWAALQVFLPRR